ncbi:photosystem II biogenesis protein Psp29 [Leptolyngbya sp. 7M]|uniref:photosystem II biogenesis protein Psp29 n=1 Tax=Leptolyngbya sp. 7M TaxID=2812896 RepID=UPI001B8C0075|nr:photosystem II biogenesis protein Psp29 [Leptolyngbya sp. 7M]QYO63422.1 photosystem II biogenesis protein Psp29 [Leptolyngbya sp. 7M]
MSSNVRTVSETKRAFYTLHTRPINSIYRRVVDELMVEMHLLSVNADYRYDPIYGLGVVTAFDRFMQGYRPEADKTSIFNALCQALQDDAQKYRRDAEQLQSEAAAISADDFLSQVKQLNDATARVLYVKQPIDASSSVLYEVLRAVANNPKFKYSRLFAIGLYTVLELMDPSLVKDESKRNQALQTLSEVLNLSGDKMQKDLELYRSNLDKIAQAQIVLDDILKADRKKKEERAKAKDTVTTPSDSQESS